MRYAWFVLLVAGMRFVFAAIKTSPGDGDLAWQRRLGRTILATHHIPRALGMESFTAPGAPWTPQEWAFSLLALHTATAAGWCKVGAFVAFCAMLALALTAWRAARLGASPWFVASVTAFTGMAMYNSFGIRAQVLGWPLLGLTMLFLDEEGPWMWAAVPVAALWSNLHASVMLAPGIALAVVVGRWVEDRAWTPRVRRAAQVCAAIALAVCCNPFGVGLPLYAVSLLSAPFKNSIDEWQNTDLSRFAFDFGALPLLACALVLGVARDRRRVQDALVFAAFTVLMLLARRNVALFAIVVAPLVARALTSPSSLFAKRSAPSFTLMFAWAAALLAFMMSIAIPIAEAMQWPKDRLESVRPTDEIAFLRADPGTHRIFCTNFAWCSFFLDLPRDRVFLDGRADPYPQAVWTDFATIAYLRPRWRERLDAYGIDVVLAEHNAPLEQALAEMQQWREAVSDKKFDLWIRY